MYFFTGGGGGYDCGANNPCTPANINAGKLYHPHHEETKFVQCDQYGRCYVMPCEPGTKWNQATETCT